jgi:hypothetical protein
MNSAASSKASGGQTLSEQNIKPDSIKYQKRMTFILICVSPLTRFSYFAPWSFETCPIATGPSSARKRSVTLINLKKGDNV